MGWILSDFVLFTLFIVSVFSVACCWMLNASSSYKSVWSLSGIPNLLNISDKFWIAVLYVIYVINIGVYLDYFILLK